MVVAAVSVVHKLKEFIESLSSSILEQSVSCTSEICKTMSSNPETSTSTSLRLRVPSLSIIELTVSVISSILHVIPKVV